MANSRINLNLLICLHHILKEQSVSLAAKKMFVSQSAMSKSLAQLRELLNDPIIIRNKGGIEVTSTAQAMQYQVDDIVCNAFNFFDNSKFSPEKSRKIFSVLCDEVTMKCFIPQIIHKLTMSAPAISLDLLPVSPDAMFKLEKRHVDIGLFFSQEENVNLSSTVLLHDQLMVVMNKNHPLANHSITSENLVDYSFITLTPEHKQYIKTTLAINNTFSRKVVAKLPSVSLIFDMLEQTTCIAILPEMSLEMTKKKDQFLFKPLCLPQVTNCVPLNLFWNPTLECNSANRWLRRWLQDNLSMATNAPKSI